MPKFKDMLKSAASSQEFRFLSSLFFMGRTTVRTCPNPESSAALVKSPERIFLRDVPFNTPFLIPNWAPAGTNNPFWMRTNEFLISPQFMMGGGSFQVEYLITEELASTLVEVHPTQPSKAQRMP